MTKRLVAASLILMALSACGYDRGDRALSGAGIGAAVTALLFTVGKWLIGLYIGRRGIASGFGAAGSFVVLLVWVYYSTQIFLLGAEFTWVYAHERGSRKGQARPGAPQTKDVAERVSAAA